MSYFKILVFAWLCCGSMVQYQYKVFVHKRSVVEQINGYVLFIDGERNYFIPSNRVVPNGLFVLDNAKAFRLRRGCGLNEVYLSGMKINAKELYIDSLLPVYREPRTLVLARVNLLYTHIREKCSGTFPITLEVEARAITLRACDNFYGVVTGVTTLEDSE